MTEHPPLPKPAPAEAPADPRASPRNRAATLLLVIAFALVAGAGAALTATRAAAVFQDLAETGRPGYLVLGAESATPLWATLGPGDTMRWLVRASLADAESGSLEVELEVRDALPHASGMTAEIVSCDGAFDLDGTTPACDGVSETPLPETTIAQLSPTTGRIPLARLERAEPRELLVTLSLPAGERPQPADGTLARVGLGVHAAGEERAAPPPRRLAATGEDAMALGVLALGLIGTGTGLALRRRGAS